MSIKLSDYVFKFLREKDVKCVFMLPGGGAMHLCDSLGRSDIEYIPFLHEQGASIAAEAYAQHTNTPGVVLVTSGPGATNAITAVTAGWIDSTPMFVVSGQSKRADLVGNRGVRQIGSQEVNIMSMVKGITKYAIEVMNPEEIRYHLEKGWYEATTGRPGPVWISIPLDVQATLVDESELNPFSEMIVSDANCNKRIVEEAAKKTIDYLKKSRKPLFVAGNGIKLAGAISDFCKLAEKLNVPVQTTWKTIDFLDENDPLYIGHPGIMGDRGANMILQEADLLISIGSRLDTSITAFNEPHFGMKAKKVIIDIDLNEIKRMDMDIEVSCACDAGDFIRVMINMCQQEKEAPLFPDFSSWISYCKNLRLKYPVVTKNHKIMRNYVSAYYFVNCLCDLLRSDDVIVPESAGGAGEITYQAWRIKKGQKMKNAAGLGSMGFGLPYAIGACIANDGRRTILINGDGAFQLNIQELETLHRMKLPVKIFLWCNDGYASIRSMQSNNFEGRYVACEKKSGLTIPNMKKVAEAYGFQTYEINNNDDVEDILTQVLKDDEQAFCLLHVNPDETVSPRVKAFIEADGNIRSGVLEKMWPIVDE